MPLPYPPARWRLVAPSRLDSVLLNFSHILIRYAGIESNQATLTAADWFVTYPALTRSREEALRFALHLAERIQRGEAFDHLARQHSDDPLTRGRGGSLGGQSAAHLVLWPEVLDALAQTTIGQVTRPIHLLDGFHLFVRHAPPAGRTLSGRRLVIGHDRAPWLAFNARGTPVSRTRDEAFALARRLRQELKSHPETFERRARELSEHLDAERGGDIGTWTTLEPSDLWRELEVLGELDVGEVSEAVDGLFGVEILQRTPDRPRATYAAEFLRLRFKPGVPDEDEYSQRRVFERAMQLATTVAAEPELFSSYHGEYCCNVVEHVVEGRGWAPLEIALSKLKPGQVGTAPVLGEAWQYLVLKRLDDVTPLTHVTFELPQPARPDVDYFMATDGPLVARVFEQVRDNVAGELALPGKVGEEVRHYLAAMSRAGQEPPETRIEMLNEISDRLRQLLGVEEYSDFVRSVDHQFERLLLAPYP